jgi:hypothetical protein
MTLALGRPGGSAQHRRHPIPLDGWRDRLRPQLKVTPARTILLAAFICWLASLRSLGHAPVSQYGLLAAGSPLFVTSIALTGAGFVLAARESDLAAAWASVAMSIATLRVSVSLATAVPFYSWTYKHIAVADYIQQTGTAARDSDIYQHWNGLFAATAWLSDVSGINIIALAHWFTPAVYVIAAFLVYAVARVWQCPPMTAVVATFLVQNLDWVGQSYYSPQCTAYLLALGVVGLIGWGLRSGRCTRAVIGLILVLFTAIVVTHQLTPYWLILLSVLLTVTGRLRPRWLMFAMIGIAVGFLAYNWSSASHFGLLNATDPVANAQTNVPTIGVFGQRITSLIVRLLSGTVWASALICAIVAAFRRRPFLVPTLLAFSSFGILFGQGYGGEAIFRVFLFSLPGCAMLIAPAVERLAKIKLTLMPLVALCAAAAVASGQGLFGAWSSYRMPADEVALSTKLMQISPVPTYITAAAPVWPERNSARYVDFARWNPSFDITMVFAAKLVGSHFSSPSEYGQFMSVVQARGATPTYMIITTQMQVYDWYFGILPWDAIPNLQKHIDKDPRWKPYYLSPTVHVYKLVTQG